MEKLTVSEVREKYGGKAWTQSDCHWIAVADSTNDLVELYDFPLRATTLPVYQNIPEIRALHKDPLFVEGLVLGSVIRRLRVGKAPSEAIPAVKMEAITEVKLLKDTIEFTILGTGGYSEILGGGLLTEKFANSAIIVKRSQQSSEYIVELKRFDKVVIGIDDTDNQEEGATIWLCANLGALIHDTNPDACALYQTSTFLFWGNPYKTSNNASHSIAFGVRPQKKQELVEFMRDYLARHSFSDHTAMAIHERILVPEGLVQYALDAKARMVDLSEAKAVAATHGVTLMPITGERGLIGAVAALGLRDEPKKAMAPSRPAAPSAG